MEKNKPATQQSSDIEEDTLSSGKRERLGLSLSERSQVGYQRITSVSDHVRAPISKTKAKRHKNTPAIHLFCQTTSYSYLQSITELYTRVNFKFIYTRSIQLSIYKMLYIAGHIVISNICLVLQHRHVQYSLVCQAGTFKIQYNNFHAMHQHLIPHTCYFVPLHLVLLFTPHHHHVTLQRNSSLFHNIYQ